GIRDDLVTGVQTCALPICRSEIIKIEERVLAKEDEIDRKLTELTRREQGVSDRETHSKQLQEELKEAKDGELKELERISGMTTKIGRASCREREKSEVVAG